MAPASSEMKHPRALPPQWHTGTWPGEEEEEGPWRHSGQNTRVTQVSIIPVPKLEGDDHQLGQSLLEEHDTYFKGGKK